MKNGPMDVYLDSAPENITPELALGTERVRAWMPADHDDAG